MNSGVYCRPKSETEVYDSIIIDRYNKIFGETQATKNKESKARNMDSLGPSSSEYTNSSEEEKWESGMNVRARFADDGEYYEATIEKIFDEYAVVRYLGYDNEEAVKLKDLRPSLGEESITEQLKKAAEEKDAEEDDDEDEEAYEEEYDFEWKVGMSCRALYEPNEVVYEAVIQEVSPERRKAVVIMSGYGIPFEVSFDDMYESIPELRIKQERSAKTYLESKAKSQENEGTFPPDPSSSEQKNDIKFNKNEAKVFQAFQTVLPDVKLGASNAGTAHAELPNINPNVPMCNFSNCQGILRPQSENDALACLISSNYLSGYYAGYYDCLRKHQNSNRQV